MQEKHTVRLRQSYEYLQGVLVQELEATMGLIIGVTDIVRSASRLIDFHHVKYFETVFDSIMKSVGGGNCPDRMLQQNRSWVSLAFADGPRILW